MPTPDRIETQAVVADIGGTHARFAIATLRGRTVVDLSAPVVLRAADHAGLIEAWAVFAAQLRGGMPRAAALALAGPVTGGLVRFTNSAWRVDPDGLEGALDVDRLILMNDFAAVAQAVDSLPDHDFAAVCGPSRGLPAKGAVTVLGLGTGLGVAALRRDPAGGVVLPTEGAHITFAPQDAAEAQIAAAIAEQHGRVSVERLVAGPGLGAIVRAGDPADARPDAELWDAALAGEGSAAQALDTLLAAFGAFAGDAALLHGAAAIVLTGGLVNRLGPRLAASRFQQRFCDKGRYRPLLEGVPIMRLRHREPGLWGAAVALANAD